MGGPLSLVLISSLALPTLARAQDIEMDPPAAPAPTDAPVDTAPSAVVKDAKVARKWRDAGTTLVKQGDAATKKAKLDEAKQLYENALTAFTNAYAASEDLALYVEIGAVNEKLGRFDVAATSYRKVVTVKTGVKADVLRKATTRFDDVTAKVGSLTLGIKPDETTVTLAGVDVGKSPLAEALFLMPGAYTFSFTADGFQPKDVEIKIEAGSESERSIELEPIKIIISTPTPDYEPPVEIVKPVLPSKLPLIIGASVTGAAAITAVVTGLMARKKHDTFVAPASTGDEREDARVAGKNLALTTDIAIGVGVVAAGVTAGYYLFKYRPAVKKYDAESRPPPTRAPGLSMAKVLVSPWVKGDAGGFALAGSF